MTTAYTKAKKYAAGLADRLVRVDLMEFFVKAHEQFYPDLDIAFMEYFLAISQREGEFVVHHSKLLQYGVMRSEQSTHVKEKLSALGLVEEQDYLLTDIREQDSRHGGSNKKEYYLTPESFKTCLLRAKRSGQPIDPVIYSKYYLLLEKIFGLYRDYQAAYQEKVIAMKDDKIDKLIKDVADQQSKIADQSSIIHELRSMALTQSDKMDKLIDYAEDIKSRLDDLFDFTSSFAQTTLSTWIGSLVFKSQLDQLIKDKDLSYALKHLKVMFTVAFYQVQEQETTFTIYFCCTNFADANKRIRELFNREEGAVMLKPEAICLMSQEINCERSKLQQLVLDADAAFTFNNRRKSYQVTLATTKLEAIQQKYAEIVASVRKENFQGYQARRDLIIAENSDVNAEIIEQMVKADASFFQESLPRCQDFIDCATVRGEHGYKPVPSISRKLTLRDDLNERLSDAMYALRKLHSLFGDDGGVQEIKKMIRDGVMTKRDLKSLAKLGKAAAQAENVTLTANDKAQLAEVEALPDT